MKLKINKLTMLGAVKSVRSWRNGMVDVKDVVPIELIPKHAVGDCVLDMLMLDG